jgi:hypothetical protein
MTEQTGTMITNLTVWLQNIGNYALIGGALLILLSIPAKDKRFKTGFKDNAKPSSSLSRIGLMLLCAGFCLYGLKKLILWNSTVTGIGIIGVICLVLFLVRNSIKSGSGSKSFAPKESIDKDQSKIRSTNDKNIPEIQRDLFQTIETTDQPKSFAGVPESEGGFGPENFLADENSELIEALDKEKITYLTYGGKIFPDGKELPRARIVLANLGLQTNVKKVR